MALEQFVAGLRVRICDPVGEFDGLAGTVVRVCRRGPEPWGWVAIDQWPEFAERAYPADDARGRGNWVMVYASECEPELAVEAA
jgi:hypothetical protein